MFKNLQQRMRHHIIKTLRPGQDFQELLSIIHHAEAIHSDEQRHMFEGMIEFHDTRVREVMIPRSDIKAIDVSMPLSTAASMMAQTGVTRLPVMQGDIDHIIGMTHIWDIFQAQAKQQDVNLKTLMRPHLTVSELECVPGLLSEMRQTKNHMAIVLDEFGGTAGLVTLSDLLEEIVGSMSEVHEALEYQRGENNSIEVQARMHVEDLEALLDISLPKGDYDTVGGLIITELGRIPVRGERVLVADLDMHIQAAEPRRILRVLIKPKQD